MRLIRKSLTYILAAMLLMVAVSLVFVAVADMETRKSWLTHTVSQVLQRDLSIGGNFRLKFGNRIELLAEDVSLRNPPWASQKNMLAIEHIELQLDPFSFFSQRLNYQIQLEGAEVNLETDGSGQPSWDFGAPDTAQQQDQGDIDWLRWLPSSVDVRGLNAEFVDGQSGKIDQVNLDTIALGNVDGELNFDAEGRFNKLPISLGSNLSPVKAQTDGGFLLEVAGRLGTLEIEASGKVTGLEASGGADADIRWKVESPKLRFIEAQMFQSIPDLGPFSASGRLISHSRRHSVSDLVIDVSDKLVDLHVSGDIGDVLTGDAIALDVSIGSTKLPDLLKKLDIDIAYSLPRKLQFSGRLEGDRQKLSGKALKLTVSDPGLKLDLDGEVGNLLTLEAIDVALKGETASLSDINLPNLVPALAELGPVDVSAKITGNKNKLSFSMIDIKVNNAQAQLRITGQVADINKFQGVSILLEGSLKTPGQSLGVSQINSDAMGPATVKINLDDSAGKPGELLVNAELKTQALSIQIQGRLDDLMATNQLQLTMAVEADSLAVLGTLFDQKLAEEGPFALKAAISMQNRTVKVTDLEIKAGQSDVSGDLTLVMADPENKVMPMLSGKLKSKIFNFSRLDHKDIHLVVEEGATVTTRSENGERLFSTSELPFEVLQEYHIDIDVDIDKFIGPVATFNQVSTEIRLTDGILQLHPFTANINKQPVYLELLLNAASKPAKFKLKLMVAEFELDKLAGKYDFLSSGIGAVDVNLEGSGNTIASIMGGLNGYLKFNIVDALLPNIAVNELSESLLHKINPLVEKDNASTLDCAALYFEFKDGKATAPRGIAVKFRNVTWLGTGDINLATEQINIAMKPKPRKGLGITINQLARLVLVNGTIMNPSIQLDPEGVVGATATYAAAISTAGLTLLVQGLWDKNQANAPVCKYVITGEDGATAKPLEKLFKAKPFSGGDSEDDSADLH